MTEETEPKERRWVEVSFTDALADVSIEEVMAPEGLDEHERLKKALWDHLVRLENNVLILEDLVSFPGLKMLVPGKRVLDWLGLSLFEHTIIIVWRVWSDKDASAVTLKRLRRCVWEHLHEEYKEPLAARLREMRPSGTVKSVIARAEAVRHGRLAHIDREYRFDEARRVAGLTVSELRLISDFFTNYFNGLQFGIQSMFGLSSFERRHGRHSNIVRMMETLVLGGPYCRRYDERGPAMWWRGFGSRLTADEIEWLSELRQRNGLDPISEDLRE